MIAAAQVHPRDSRATPKGTLPQKETTTDATQAAMPTRPKPSPRPDRGANRDSVNSNDGQTSRTNQTSTPRSVDTRAQIQELTDVEDKPRVRTLVAKHIPVIVHTLSSPVPHVFLELLPQGRDDRGLFLLNVYSPPSRPRDVFDGLFRVAIHATRGRTDDLVMVGDFNATYPALGYAKATIKGRRLMDAIDVHRLTLLNESDQPTRISNCVSRDTCPDLTLARTHDECAWTNLGENLGSDHFILETRSFFFSPERLYREHRDAFELPEEIFWKQYRLPKIVVRWLCDELREEPEVGRVRTSWTVMTVELQVLCALRFYGTGSFQGMVASDEHVARDQKTVSVAVRAVSVAIVRRLGVQRGWIHFPEKPSERFDAEKGFRLFGRIPGVISCVDGTMVSIVGPSKNDPTVTKAAYWCRKYFYALNVMVVSTPGSVLPPSNSHRHYFGMCSAPLHLPCIEQARTGVRLRP
ncbi:hypothetical protein ISCGN_014683 [Ixodes scapularis]